MHSIIYDPKISMKRILPTVIGTQMLKPSQLSTQRLSDAQGLLREHEIPI